MVSPGIARCAAAEMVFSGWTGLPLAVSLPFAAAWISAAQTEEAIASKAGMIGTRMPLSFMRRLTWSVLEECSAGNEGGDASRIPGSGTTDRLVFTVGNCEG